MGTLKDVSLAEAGKWGTLNEYAFFDKVRYKLTLARDKSFIVNYFSYFSTKTYVMGSQKNCLNEARLLSTQNALSEW